MDVKSSSSSSAFRSTHFSLFEGPVCVPRTFPAVNPAKRTVMTCCEVTLLCRYYPDQQRGEVVGKACLLERSMNREYSWTEQLHYTWQWLCLKRHHSERASVTWDKTWVRVKSKSSKGKMAGYTGVGPRVIMTWTEWGRICKGDVSRNLSHTREFLIFRPKTS